MSAFRVFASLSLALVLGSGVALAQNQTPDDAQNPHSTKNKDRATPADNEKTETEKSETANPHSTLNKDRTLPADPDRARDLDRAEKDNPHHAMNKDHDLSGGKVTASAVIERLNMSDQNEIEMGKLAQENGGARVQQFGKTLEDDHTRHMQQLKDLAKKKGMTLSMQPKDGMAMHHMKESQEMREKMGSLRGADFDKPFAKMMVDAHQKNIDHLNAWRTSVKDEDLAALIDQTLPVLQRHLSAAQQLQRPAAQGRTP